LSGADSAPNVIEADLDRHKWQRRYETRLEKNFLLTAESNGLFVTAEILVDVQPWINDVLQHNYKVLLKTDNSNSLTCSVKTIKCELAVR